MRLHRQVDEIRQRCEKLGVLERSARKPCGSPMKPCHWITP